MIITIIIIMIIIIIIIITFRSGEIVTRRAERVQERF